MTSTPTSEIPDMIETEEEPIVVGSDDEQTEDKKPMEMQTYIVVGTLPDGSPALYTGINVDGLTRQFEANLGQVKTVLDTVSNELMYRAVAGQVIEAMEAQNRNMAPGQQVAAAMQERLKKE